MQDIIKEYGPAVITVVAIVAIAGLVTLMFVGGEGSTIGQALASMIKEMMKLFVDTADAIGSAGGEVVVTP